MFKINLDHISQTDIKLGSFYKTKVELFVIRQVTQFAHLLFSTMLILVLKLIMVPKSIRER